MCGVGVAGGEGGGITNTERVACARGFTPGLAKECVTTMTNCDDRERKPVVMPEDSAWTVSQAAAFLGIGTSTLYKKAADGTVPSFKVGGALRFSPKKLTEWRDAQHHEAGV